MVTLAVIDQFATGLLLVWPLIGLAAGYGVALFDPRDDARLLVPTLLGLAGGLVGGTIAGAVLRGHGLWMANVAAALVAAVLALGYARITGRRTA
ncbi:MAG TPA: hypothetical protein VGH33_02720 [Isosphaeraceae bacterium]|jgi:hypothetical protein